MRRHARFHRWLGIVAALTLVIPPTLADVGDPDPYCWAVSDGGDTLIYIHKDGTGECAIGVASDGDTISNIETIAYDPRTATLYAANEDSGGDGVFGILDTTQTCAAGLPTVTFTAINATSSFGTCDLDGDNVGDVTLTDPDSLHFDDANDIMWAVHRDGADFDVLFQVDLNTGTFVADAFDLGGGTTVDCVRVTGPTLPAGVEDIDDIASDPTTGLLYGVANDGGSNDYLVNIETSGPNSGQVSDVTRFYSSLGVIFDMEGLTFSTDGELFGTTGAFSTTAADNNSLWTTELTSALTTRITQFSIGTDHEAVACLTDNIVSGTVFFDADADGVLEPADGDSGFAGVTVTLYRDDGTTPNQVDAGDTPLFTTDTGVSGSYLFRLAATGAYVLDIDTADLPTGAALTTDNLEEADFAAAVPFYGNTDAGNDFGFELPLGQGDLDIVKASDVAPGSAVPGQTVTYTLTVTNNGTGIRRGIVLTDLLPPGVAYVAQSTVVSGFEAGSLTSVASDDFESAGYAGGTGWTGSWTEINEGNGPNAGDERNINDLGDRSLQVKDNDGGGEGVYRQVDLSGAIEAQATFEWRRINLDNVNDYVTFDVSIDGGSTWTERARFHGPTGNEPYQTYPPSPTDFGLPPRPIPFPQPLAADTRVRFLSSPSLGNNDILRVDNFTIEASFPTAVTLDNVPAGVNGDLGAGAPPDLVTAADGLVLAPGASMTVTYQVTVDSPLDANVTELVNAANVDCDECAIPGEDTVNDPVSPGAILGDLVWLDADGDGVRDVGEPGLANVEITLFDTGADMAVGGGDDVAVATAVTDLAGGYLFTHVRPGTGPYYVDVTGATVPGALVLSAGSTDPSATVTVTGEDTFLGLDFGYTSPASTAVIGDFIWSDADADGVQDPGEPGIGGVGVDLVGPGPDGVLNTADDVVVDSTTTSADGRYLFPGVAAGSYVVDVDETSAAIAGDTLTSGPQSQGTDPGTAIAVAAGGAYLNADFGYFDAAKASISDAVWRDVDEDGVRDAGEAGFAGVTVSLLDSGGDVVATTTTDAAGDFSFSGVAAGSYTLVITDTANVLSGFGGTTTYAENRQRAVNAGDSFESFAFNAEGVVGDVVWSDADGDGVQDPGEPGIAGVTVDLIGPGPDGTLGTGDDVVLDTAITGAAGTFLFLGLDRGDYLTRVTDTGAVLAGTSQTGDPDVPAAPCGGSCDDEGTATVPRAGEDLTLDFGYRDTTRPDVSGNVFEDLDADSLDDGAGEPGIAGVTVALVDSGGGIVAVTTTDANGDYTFPDLAAGSYTVQVTDTAGVLLGYRLNSGLDQIPVTVAAADVSGVDFGYVRGSATGSIGDEVWLDGDGDGLRDGAEAGISGVTVELYDPGSDGAPGGGDDVLLASTVTDADGGYRFTGLAAGSYYAQVDTTTLPGGGAGLTATAANPTAVIHLSEAERYGDADFGFNSSAAVAALGDFVWYDADGDGLQDAGEVGIAGVEIQITGPGCTPCTTLTGADGSYLFTGLMPGGYTVTFDPSTLPAGYNTAATNGDPQQASPWAGVVDSSIDFGFNAPAGTTATIGDRVWLDADGDGVQDAGEPGLAGVTVDLLDDATGTVLATTVTEAGGAYDFVGVPPGSYKVAVRDTAGVLDGLDLSGGTNPTATLTVAAGDDENGADFGFQSARGSIGNLVWHDTNGDGDVDAGEPGLAGVTVEVWLDTNGNGSIDPGTDNLIRKTRTGASGEYEVTGLVAGDYLVTVTDDDGVLTGFDIRTSGTAGTDDNSQADPYAVTLTAGGDDVTADFGFFDSAAAHTLSGEVFFDLDGDGTIDPGDDLGVGAAFVRLFRDLDGDGVLDPGDVLIDTEVSVPAGPNQGQYTFPNLPNGDYLVVVSAVGTFVDGGIQTTQLSTASVQPVTLAGTDSTGNDFGFTLTATVVLISEVSAFVDDGRVVVEWQTAAESNSVGFFLYRWDDAKGEYHRVNEDLVPTLFDAPQGGVYRIVDETALPSESLTYALVEVQAKGMELTHGPYDLEVSWERDPRKLAPSHGSYEARPHPVPAHELARLKHRRDAVARAAFEKSAVQAEAIKLKVREEGLFYVPLAPVAELLGEDLGDVTARARWGRISLTHRGAPVAWLADDTFQGIFFYSQGLDSLYTLDDVYWLRLANGDVMERRQAASPAPAPDGGYRQRQHFEEDAFPVTLVPRDPKSDNWPWKGITAGHPDAGRATVVLELTDLAPSTDDAALTVFLWGASESAVPLEHHAKVSLNGTEIGETRWDGFEGRTVSFHFPQSLLAEGANTVEVTGVLDTGAASSLFFIDGFDVEYERFYRARGDRLRATSGDDAVVTVDGFTRPSVRIFDVTDAESPVYLADAAVEATADGYQVSFVPLAAGSSFFAVDMATLPTPEMVADRPSDLRSPSNRGDYLVVTSGDLRAAAERLASYRRGDGWEPMVIEVEDVMDEFNDGIFDPESLRDFFAYAYNHWELRPRAVVLAGSGNFDYRDLRGLGGNVVPPILVGTPLGLYSSDNHYVDVAGDELPEIEIGRLPVLTADELDALVAKMAAYESAAGDWTRRAVLAADDADSGGNFQEASEGAAGHLGGLDLRRIYLDQLSFDTARSQLLAELQEGAALFNYLGHGGVKQLGQEGLLTEADTAVLSNQERLFVLSSLTCHVARFDIPGFSSLGESLVLDADGGALAVWSPTGLALNFESRILDEAFAAAFADPATLTVGDAVHSALAAFAAEGHYGFMIELLTLLGDPGAVLHREPAVDPAVFSDGFESGGLEAWSAAVP